ncbi:MAG: N-acetylneuraminate synthase family protein [Anaerolineae bacterium]|nr:N-acetylneuraminate synthase family protein [Anaerolineae bacterium]
MKADANYFYIGDRLVGDNQPCFIIAEAGVNHNGSLDTALKLVDVAVEANADAVKFQKRNLKSLYPLELLNNPNSAEWSFQYLLPILKQTELSYVDFRQIKAHCDRRGIRFMCTPWDEHSLLFLEDIGLEAYKVASADLVNMPLLEKLVETGKPLLLSTGMATLREIERTVTFLEKRRASFALLHCVSTYPAPFENLNLRFIETLKRFGVPVGYSGHERGIAVSVAALTMGACIIEKHITLDRTSPGPDHPASLEPNGIQKLIRDLRNVEISLGKYDKELSTMEMLNRQVLRKSLVATHNLPAGTIVTREMVKVKGPGKGLSPQRLDELLGAKLAREIKADEYFTKGDLSAEVGTTIQANGLRHPWGLKARFHDLVDILAKKPHLVELHFSEADINHPFAPPLKPFKQQLFIHAPEFTKGRLIDLCSMDETKWEQDIFLLQQTINRAADLQQYFSGGTVGVVIHVGGMSMDEPILYRERLLQQAIKAFKRLDSKGCLLLPENLPPRPWYLGGQWFQNVFIRPEEMTEFCQELSIGMTLDLSHAQLFCNAYDKSLHKYVQHCLPYIRHLHIADARGIDSEGLQIGEGVIAWDTILELLSEADFTWVPEIWSGHLQNGAGFVEAINRLISYRVL